VIPVIHVLHVFEGLNKVVAQVGLGDEGIDNFQAQDKSAEDDDPGNDY
jgi:hypothetical protein